MRRLPGAGIIRGPCDWTICSRARRAHFPEFFPPRKRTRWHTLEDTIEQLIPLGPDFVSVTYGAGGGTREKTRVVVHIHLEENTSVPAMAHLTCVNATRAELRGLLDEYASHGS